MDLWGRWKKTTVANQLMVALTAVIALATLCNVAVAYFQWRVMNGSDQETKQLVNAAEKQAAAVERGIDASNAYLAATRHLTEALNAADLSANPPQAWDPTHQYSIYNNGLSPAQAVSVRVTLSIRRLSDGAVVDDYEKTLHFDRLTPRSVTARGFQFALPSMSDLFERGEAISSVMRVRYDNGFGHPAETRRCNFFTVQKPGSNPQASTYECDVLENDPVYGAAARAEMRDNKR